jgi:sugar phosphate permease
MKGASGPKLLSIGLGFATFGYAGAAMSSSLLLTSVAIVIASIGSGMMLPTMLTWVLQVLPHKVRGRGTGLWTGIFFFGQFSAPLVVVALQKNMGGLAPVLLLFAGLCAIGVVLSATKIKGAEVLVTH